MKFVPNLGAEEGTLDPALHPFLHTPIRCLSWILPAGAELLGWEDDAPWPKALGPPASDPAFPWIQGEGLAWYADEAAADALRAAGARPSFAEPGLVRRIHDKAFAHGAARSLGWVPACLVDHLRVLEPDAIDRETVAGWVQRLPPWVGRDWMLKPRHGSSGRGRVRRLDDVEGARARLAARGGALFEPWLRRIVDLSALLYVERDGALRWIGSTRQLLRGAGVYLGTEAWVEPSGEIRAGTRWDAELRAAAEDLGRAAAKEGYFGPLGLDAFVFHGPDGEPVLRPVVELNARFTMGIVAAGLLRRALGAGTLPAGAAFRFLLRARELPPGAIDLGGGASLEGLPTLPALG